MSELEEIARVAASSYWPQVAVLAILFFGGRFLIGMIGEHFATLRGIATENKVAMIEFRAALKDQADAHTAAMRELTGQVAGQAHVIQESTVSVHQLARCVRGLAFELKRGGVSIPPEETAEGESPHRPPSPQG